MSPINIAIVGVGKIARDQHLPVIGAHADFNLKATASPDHRIAGVPGFPDMKTLLDANLDIDAVAICTPPQDRYSIARAALRAGLHVLLEKPPTATLCEIEALVALAKQKNVALFAAWHSREAFGVAPARNWAATRRARNVHVEWKEDVRVWHPGQRWIWQAGGLGVFDPGINALSILTHILPGPLVLKSAQLSMPSNCQTPIKANLHLTNMQACHITVELDFLEPGEPRWNVDIDADGGHLQLSKGGAVLRIDGGNAVTAPDAEYAGLYTRFARLVRERRIDVDVTPLSLVADAYLCGARIAVAPFYE